MVTSEQVRLVLRKTVAEYLLQLRRMNCDDNVLAHNEQVLRDFVETNAPHIAKDLQEVCSDQR